MLVNTNGFALLIIMASMLLAASPSIALPTTEMSKRIVGGFLVASGFAPYAVFLQMANGGGSITVCGGSIISPEYVITAAHCVVADGKVRASSSITANYNNMDKAKQARVKALEVHVLSGYITKTGTDTTYDMAILKIPKLTFGQNTQRIPIYPGKIGANQDIMAIGWGGIESGGLSSQLRGVVLKTGDKKSCWGANSKVGDNNGAQVCALIKLTPNMSTCGGDSGSSVVIGNGNTPMLVGMVSVAIRPSNSSCGDSNGLRFFLHPYHYIDFIINTTKLSRDYLTGGAATEKSNNAMVVTKTVYTIPTFTY